MVEQSALGEYLTVSEQHLELATRPINWREISGIEATLGMISILGAMNRLGLEIKSSEDTEVVISNPLTVDKEGSASGMVSFRNSIRDVTAQITANFLENNVLAPSPLGIEFFNPDVRIYTSNSHNPEEGVLGIDAFLGYLHFEAIFSDGELTRFDISTHMIDPEGKYSIGNRDLKTVHHDGQVFQIELSQFVETDNPLFKSSERVFRRLRFIHWLLTEGAPSIIVMNEQKRAKSEIVDLINVLGAKFEGEEVSGLVNRLAEIPVDETLKVIFERAGVQEKLASILNMLKEDMNPIKYHGFAARLSIHGDEMILTDATNFGATTHLVPRWKQEIADFIKQESRDWLVLLIEIQEILESEFENFASLVNGKIQCDRTF